MCSSVTGPRTTRYTHAVYASTICRSTTVAIVITNSVNIDDDASHTVRLDTGSSDGGSRNGKRLTPAVAMMPTMARPLHRNAS